MVQQIHALKTIYSRKVVLGMVDQWLSETAIVNYILLYIIVINFKIWLIFEVPSCDFADE